MKENYDFFGFAVLFSLFILYSVAWYFIYRGIEGAVKNFINQAPEIGITFQEAVPTVFGYPLSPTIYYSGEVKANGKSVVIPEMDIKGYYIPHTPITLRAPYGFIYESVVPELTAVDKASLTITMPSWLPGSAYEEDIIRWQREVGIISIKKLTLLRGETKVEASGYIALDDALQIKAEMTARIYGYKEFLDGLTAHSILSPHETGLISTALSSFGKTDPLSKALYLDVPVSIRNRIVYAGPAPVARLPLLVWGRRSLPVLLPRSHGELPAFP